MSSSLLADNINLIWSSLIIAELVKNGIDTFFVSPGNRNAPLIAALARHDGAVKRISIDERAAGYRALGHAKATGVPGVLVCTSGTAPANYYPAVIEAFRDEVPLIVLSADRPPELVGSDANQTILQHNLYGAYCRDSLFLPCPAIDYPLEALLAKIDHLVARPNGPVHINCPFREPLTPGIPDVNPLPGNVLATARLLHCRPLPYTAYHRREVLPADLNAVIALIRETDRGLVVIGRLDTPQDLPALDNFLQKTRWPVFCDIASSMKGFAPPETQVFSLDHPEAVRLVGAYAPETILQFGSGLVSKHYYASILPQSRATVVQIGTRRGLRDPAHRVNIRISVPIPAFVVGLEIDETAAHDSPARSSFLGQMQALQESVQQRVPSTTLNLPRIAGTILSRVPDGEGLFLGNSLAIRAFDAIAPPFAKQIRVISNRGVSGIEGGIATSIGFAEASTKRVTAVIGDISFLHDLNSLLMLRESTAPVILIVINNGGGRIFERLPIRDFPDIVDPYMTTPHKMDFRRLAEQFSLPYFSARTPGELAAAYGSVLDTSAAAILETVLPPEEDLRVFHAMQKVRL